MGHFFIDRRLRYCPEPDRYYYDENGKTRPAVSFRQLRLSVFAGNAVLRVRCSTHSGPQSSCDFILIRPGSIDGIIRKVGSSVVARSDITLVFLFDQHGKMQSYAISEVVTSP